MLLVLIPFPPPPSPGACCVTVPVLVPVSRAARQPQKGAGQCHSSAQGVPHHEGKQQQRIRRLCKREGEGEALPQSGRAEGWYRQCCVLCHNPVLWHTVVAATHTGSRAVVSLPCIVSISSIGAVTRMAERYSPARRRSSRHHHAPAAMGIIRMAASVHCGTGSTRLWSKAWGNLLDGSLQAMWLLAHIIAGSPDTSTWGWAMVHQHLGKRIPVSAITEHYRRGIFMCLQLVTLHTCGLLPAPMMA